LVKPSKVDRSAAIPPKRLILGKIGLKIHGVRKSRLISCAQNGRRHQVWAKEDQSETLKILKEAEIEEDGD